MSDRLLIEKRHGFEPCLFLITTERELLLASSISCFFLVRFVLYGQLTVNRIRGQ